MKKLDKESYVEKYTRKNGSIGLRTHNNDPSQTNPDGAEQADINYIVREFGRTGHWPIGSKQGLYTGEESVPMPTDLITAHQLIDSAKQKFEELPSKIRERFHNDPIKLSTFLTNPNNKDEAIKLGLLTAVPKNDDSNDDKTDADKKSKSKASSKTTES